MIENGIGTHVTEAAATAAAAGVILWDDFIKDDLPPSSTYRRCECPYTVPAPT